MAALLDRWGKERQSPVRYRVFSGPSQLLDAARRERFTLYLLDVVLPGMDGIAAAKELRGLDETAAIIFLSSFPDFAYRSYGVRATDYLLKPVCGGDLFPLLDRLALEEQRPRDGLTVKCGAALVRIPFARLAYLEVNSKHLYFNLTDRRVREVFGTLSAYEPLLLARPEFRRVHRSYIVNLLQVEELSPAGIRTFSGKTIPVSRTLYPQVQRDYMDLLLEP